MGWGDEGVGEARVPVTVLGRAAQAPEADCWLRALHRLAAAQPERMFFHSGFYCWNDRCKACVLTLRRGGETLERQACRIRPQAGDELCALPRDMALSGEEPLAEAV